MNERNLAGNKRPTSKVVLSLTRSLKRYCYGTSSIYIMIVAIPSPIDKFISINHGFNLDILMPNSISIVVEPWFKCRFSILGFQICILNIDTITIEYINFFI